ncbi:hypothetical protein AB0N14_13595 [Streptomyces sp. NPDC051104]|uniref:hypothetical protein n=1 Tax=Streptomyces sp. NPDC051104 TaxID=3155044 RepID=UPI003446E7B4
MLRNPVFRWSLLAAVLIVIGAWPAAVAPIALAGAGLAVVIGAIPGPVLLLAGLVVWLKHRPAPVATA